ncbi:uncharacterized protein TNCV_2746411 [Trichonephila clavipes]|nr:uncharacterized protein TNCV_2746411 [Trichonephila clavipes]
MILIVREFQADLVDMQSLAEFNKGLKDLQGEEIKGTYYEAELQKVVDSGFYPVENIMKQRKRRGITEYFVKFLGYPEKFNDWVTDIQKVKIFKLFYCRLIFKMSFYVTLPSDSSMHFFPENKISHFKTQLPSPVCLNGEWEVGLSEIIYPHSWLNVKETNNYFLYKVGDGNISSTVKRTIDVGCYETMLDIISAVQLALPKNPNRFTIIYNKEQNG